MWKREHRKSWPCQAASCRPPKPCSLATCQRLWSRSPRDPSFIVHATPAESSERCSFTHCAFTQCRPPASGSREQHNVGTIVLHHIASDLIATGESFDTIRKAAKSDRVISVTSALGPSHASADTKTSEHVWTMCLLCLLGYVVVIDGIQKLMIVDTGV